MGDLAIRVENLGKLYRIGQRRRYKTFGEALTGTICAPFRSARAHLSGPRVSQNAQELDDTIWALKGVSFEVKHGEIIGIIGRNGSGKSTLLKILSRITLPSEGYAEIHGRVGALLEVGTGFHSELTGRENIYLSGVILGMKKVEIKRQLDEIIAFAEIEKFLDTAVKHYSSGMYMRLAFAVAAHLYPEILLVDEVLAVGDAAFQRKCLGKLGEVSKAGRTVLFVSHNLVAVRRLCNSVHLLEEGRIVLSGQPDEVLDRYHLRIANPSDEKTCSRSVQEGSIGFASWSLGSSQSDTHHCLDREPCDIRLKLLLRRVIRKAHFGVTIWSSDGTLVWGWRSMDHEPVKFLDQGTYEVCFLIPMLPLRPGPYEVVVSVNDMDEGNLDVCYLQPALVVMSQQELKMPPQWQGILNIDCRFEISPISN